MSKTHPTRKVWDAVMEIAEDGTITGKLDCKPDGETGRMTFDCDGERFSVYVEKERVAR